MHTCIHTYIHTYTHRPYINLYIRKFLHTFVYIYVCRPTHMRTYTHVDTQTDRQTVSYTTISVVPGCSEEEDGAQEWWRPSHLPGCVWGPQVASNLATGQCLRLLHHDAGFGGTEDPPASLPVYDDDTKETYRFSSLGERHGEVTWEQNIRTPRRRRVEMGYKSQTLSRTDGAVYVRCGSGKGVYKKTSGRSPECCDWQERFICIE